MKCKKLLSTSLLCAGLTAVPTAQAESGFYLGLGLHGGNEEVTLTNNNPSAPNRVYDVDTSGGTLKFGVILGSGDRAEVSLVNFDRSSSVSGESFNSYSAIDLDYLFVLSKDSIQPYIGLGVGSISFDNTGALYASGQDLRGVSLNISAGIIMEVIPSIEVEAGLKFKGIAWQDSTDGFYTYQRESSISSVFVGANLRF